MSKFLEFYHVTHRKNLKSILKGGLLLKYARNQRHPWVWLAGDVSLWSLTHCAINHGWSVHDLVVLRVVYRREWLTTHPIAELPGGQAYKTRRDIPASCLSLVDEQIAVAA